MDGGLDGNGITNLVFENSPSQAFMKGAIMMYLAFNI